MTPAVDVQEVMQRIRQRIPVNTAEELGGSAPLLRLVHGSNLHRLAALARERIAGIGRLPPQPPTIRARIGAVFVRIVRRALFWYTPPIQQTFDPLIQAAGEQAALTDELSRQIRRALRHSDSLEERIQSVEKSLRELTAMLSQSAGEAARPIAPVRQETVNSEFLRRDPEREPRQRQEELLRAQSRAIEHLREITDQLVQCLKSGKAEERSRTAVLAGDP
jgi:signal transduction histidine kinase